MEYLARGDAPFSDSLWTNIDDTVITSVKRVLTGRRFVPIAGPVGAGQQLAKIDAPYKEEEFKDGFVQTSGRKVVEIPQLYADFWLYWRDLQASELSGTSQVVLAAQELANTEDNMIYYGIPSMNIDGILTAKGTQNVKRSDWSTGEASFTDVSKAMTMLEKGNRLGRYALITSTDLYVQLQRIQSGTGMLESKRIENLIGSRIIHSTVLKEKTAFLVCAEPYVMDLMIGQDINTAYLELVDLNHHLRVLETALFRLKSPDGVVIFK